MPGISRHSRQMPSTPPSVKAKVGRHLLKATLIASCLILLGGDISQNPGPGYRSLDHIRKSRGLKIAHLNIRSLRHKTNSLRLEGFDTKTFDVLKADFQSSHEAPRCECLHVIKINCLAL